MGQAFWTGVRLPSSPPASDRIAAMRFFFIGSYHSIVTGAMHRDNVGDIDFWGGRWGHGTGWEEGLKRSTRKCWWRGLRLNHCYYR